MFRLRFTSFIVATAAVVFIAGCSVAPIGSTPDVFNVAAGRTVAVLDDFKVNGLLIGATIGLLLAVADHGRGWLGGLIVGGVIGWLIALIIQFAD
jgi:hypothetical protein